MHAIWWSHNLSESIVTAPLTLPMPTTALPCVGRLEDLMTRRHWEWGQRETGDDGEVVDCWLTAAVNEPMAHLLAQQTCCNWWQTLPLSPSCLLCQVSQHSIENFFLKINIPTSSPKSRSIIRVKLAVTVALLIVVCRYYRLGICLRAEHCKYSHNIENSSTLPASPCVLLVTFYHLS